ncbi:peptide/nickel transport system permease protein [Brevibacterium sanguinis]|uniref:Peptide/nickel transport system permease protein n=2 Tax=Brevibacterium TaxID=1696 RepID=A0A366IL28_9MICO|nr:MULTISPECIES: ABC transporter permease [Brevibacterium]RBP66277.1 peptide/nickel transport system permease protein [Brevibacterium sanguinis]RBP72928.1 peptide/nickel transport system permease protein [Brevibacterium celere]
MLKFILKRLLSTVLVLFVVTFVLYLLLNAALDFFWDLRSSTSPNIEDLYESRRRLLDLDTPAVVRYFKWLAGAGGCVIGQCDLGIAWYSGQEVTSQLQGAIVNTIKLITASTIVSVILGVAVGMISAIRQYSGFDYFITFVSFLLYSLPVFWVAVLLKQFGAIEINNFLSEPVLESWVPIIVVCLAMGLFWMGALGGSARRRLITFASATLITFVTIYYILASGWLEQPRIGIIGVIVIGAGTAIVMTFLSTGLGNKRVLYATLTVAALGALLYMPLQYLFYYREMNWLWMFGLLAVAIAIAIGVGLAFRGPDPWDTARTTFFTVLVIAVLVFADRVLQEWGPYTSHPAINNRPIATIGASAPNIAGDFWMTNLDSFTHLLLPSIALILISFASYTRYTRGSMLEVMGQDYIRTARAKGLNERTVVMRHALRNALLPLASIIPVDAITMIGGAVITETIFGWNGMGKLFIDSMRQSELDPIMAYIVITGIIAIVANLVADFVYAVLDPRIRVNA